MQWSPGFGVRPLGSRFSAAGGGQILRVGKSGVYMRLRTTIVGKGPLSLLATGSLGDRGKLYVAAGTPSM